MVIEEKYHAIVALHKTGLKPCQILCRLRHLPVSRSMVYRTIRRYTETGSVNKRHNGGSRPTATAPAMVRRVRARLYRNPKRSAKKMAIQVGISPRSMRRILKNKLKTKPFKIQKVQDLNDNQKATRMERARQLKSRYGKGELPNIVFTDEKIFTVEQYVNKQNDRIWATGKNEDNADWFRAKRKHSAASVMVWAGICETGRTPLVIVPQGVKINTEAYISLILENSLIPWSQQHFLDQPWTLQQDSAPAHRSRQTVEWLHGNGVRFITPQEWPPYSPDLNPMDFSIWSILENKVCGTPHASIEALITDLQIAWEDIPQETVRDCCDNFQRRLGLVAAARGNYFEN